MVNIWFYDYESTMVFLAERGRRKGQKQVTLFGSTTIKFGLYFLNLWNVKY